MNSLNDEQKCRVEASIEIAYRAARNAARKRPAHEHELASAAYDGLMKAAESFDRLGIAMPWENWAAVKVDRAIKDYLGSRFGRRFHFEMTVSPSSGEDSKFDWLDPKGEAGFQMTDISDLLAKIPTAQHGLLAHRVVFDQASRREAGEEAGFHNGNGPKAWGKVAHHLKLWAQL